MRKMKNDGFSLVELIVVIAIMAVLIAVLAPSYLKFVEKARNSTDMQNAASMVNAIQLWGLEAKIENYDTMLKTSDGEYKITVTHDSFVANDLPIQAALKNADLMNEDGTCDIRCKSNSLTKQYEITIQLTSDNLLDITYDPAWIGGESSTKE